MKNQATFMRSKAILYLEKLSVTHAFKYLSKPARIKVFIVLAIQIFLNLLDLFGVLVIGILGSITVSGLSDSTLGNRTIKILEFLNISNNSFQSQIVYLAVISASLLILKTFISMYLTKKTIFFLSKRAAELSSNLFSKLLTQPLELLHSSSTQKTIYAVTEGTNRIMVGILSNSISLISDTVLLVLMFGTLFIVDTLIGLLTISTFVIVGISLYFLFRTRVRQIGILESQYGIETSETIYEAITNYRELFVKKRRGMYSRRVHKLRFASAELIANGTFFQGISKYVMELTVVIGGFIICASQFYLHTAQHATAVLTIFLASSTRIAPAILRIQQSGLSLKQNVGASFPTFELIKKLQLAKLSDEAIEEPSFFYPEFDSEIFLKGVSFKYPDSSNLVISDLSLTIKKGSIVSIVGASGAGKTTLVDLILGIKKPDTGEVLISGLTPEEAINRWPGSIAYVPQDVAIISGSIRDNIVLGYPDQVKYNSKIERASEVASLNDFIKSLPQGINSLVGERGNKISGGQRQRIGIARALFTNPQLLVLDEATSSLDGITEHDITNSILSMRGDVTVIIIAHRLSTVVNSDLVVYLDNGKILASGKFNEVRNMVPDFERQAKLADLESRQ